jgi:hypothetical protein
MTNESVLCEVQGEAEEMADDLKITTKYVLSEARAEDEVIVNGLNITTVHDLLRFLVRTLTLLSRDSNRKVVRNIMLCGHFLTW